MASLNFKITGAAGEGIKSAGLILAKTAFRSNFSVHGYTEYPSLIRGGHNTFQVAYSDSDQTTPVIKLDLLVALTPEGLKVHQAETDDRTIVLTDQSKEKPFLHIPLLKLAKSAGGSVIHKNIVSLGASCFFLGLSLDTLLLSIKETFQAKGQNVVSQNQQAATLGFKYAQDNFIDKKLNSLTTPKTKTNQIFITGNEALALGAIAGGMKFYSAYPMTPATSILHYLALHQKEFKFVVRHAEDEIGVINMAIGASFAGARSMVATSGGGFSLMTEALGLSGVTETPLVVVLVMRPGPASGMPTWTGQGDLLFAINASQDEFPRIILTPGDPAEAFASSHLALNLSEKYQLPVVIISDKYLAESYFSTSKFETQFKNQRYGLTTPKASDEPFARYADSKSGISLRPLPGQPGGVHLANSYEHDELGYATETSTERIKQVDKRARKMLQVIKDPTLPQPILYGPESASTTLISWGSNKGVILEALTKLPDTNFVHLPVCWPFPTTGFNHLTQNSKKLVSVECNATGQLAKLIRQETGVKINQQILKYDGRPFFPSEIVAKLT
jgi:2-oxoglutarate/2-oxoacid ferredoxin oxidoreductase subunit alpha